MKFKIQTQNSVQRSQIFLGCLTFMSPHSSSLSQLSSHPSRPGLVSSSTSGSFLFWAVSVAPTTAAGFAVSWFVLDGSENHNLNSSFLFTLFLSDLFICFELFLWTCFSKCSVKYVSDSRNKFTLTQAGLPVTGHVGASPGGGFWPRGEVQPKSGPGGGSPWLGGEQPGRGGGVSRRYKHHSVRPSQLSTLHGRKNEQTTVT